MPLVWTSLGIALLLALVLVVRLDAFFALLLTALAVGVLNGLGPLAALDAVLRGVGATMGGVALVLVFGAMLGKLLDESGAAQVIVGRLAALFGPRRLPLAMALAGLLVGLPMLYNAGFLVLIPLVYALSRSSGLPLVYLGVPLASALSATHGFLPPHPAPTFLAYAYGASVGRTVLVGLAAAVPACLLGGVTFGRFLRTGAVARAVPPAELFTPREVDPAALPSVGASVGVALVPVLCMLAGAVVDVAAGTAGLDPLGAGASAFAAKLAAAVPDPALRAAVVAAKFVGNANVALGIGVAAAAWALGVRRGRTVDDVMRALGAATGGVAGLVLVIAAGGAFAQVLRDAGVADYVAREAAALRWNPILLAFTVAALLRFAVGSATVAALTTAGIVGPVAHAAALHAAGLHAGALHPGAARPELLVVATGAGSLMFSHVNDTGFWMFQRYFNLTVRQTFATWSVMEMLIALTGLGVALALGAAL